MSMRAIQITFDEALLRRLDDDDEVRRDGRSAVMRRAVAEYLRRKREDRIAQAYRTAYGEGSALGDDFAGWEHEGAWPDE
jgi:metal-responsive CopG/Arc/MetJ family transcriptional regulator